MVIKCVVLVKEQTNRLAEQNRKLRKRPTNTVKWSLKKPIQWRKDSLSTNVLSIEQLDSNVQKKKKHLSSVLCLSPQYTDTNQYHFLWGVCIRDPGSCQYTLPPHFQPLHVQPLPSQVKTHRALRTTFTISFRFFPSPNFISISFLPFVYINCFLQNGIYFLLPGFSPTLHRVEV